MSTPEPAEKLPARWPVTLSGVVLGSYWLCLFLGTHLPIDPPLDVPGGDKSMHFFGYAGLAFLLGVFLVLRRDVRASETRRFPLFGAMLLLASYGVFDELTQLLVGRHGDFQDWLADVGGITIGLLVSISISYLQPSRS